MSAFPICSPVAKTLQPDRKEMRMSPVRIPAALHRSRSPRPSLFPFDDFSQSHERRIQ